jgi:hypothetical protein
LHGEISSSVNHGNYDGAEVLEESNEDDDISDLLRDLAAGLDDRGILMTTVLFWNLVLS